MCEMVCPWCRIRYKTGPDCECDDWVGFEYCSKPCYDDAEANDFFDGDDFHEEFDDNSVLEVYS